MKKLTSTLIVIISLTACVFSQDHQPEYTSYEASGTTDMVNLLTGDFVYNMPLLHVPGPEKGFDLPLSYHAGIRYDQDASWVGLGWSLNCGAISRNVSRYPDDFQGEKISTQLDNAGITAVSRNWTVFSDVYHSEEGYGYQIMLGGLNISWGDAIDDAVSLIGIQYDFDGSNTGWSMDLEETAIGIIQIVASLVDYGIISNTVISTVVGIIDGVTTAYTTLKGLDQINSTLSNYSSMAGLWSNTVKYSWFDRECLLKTTQKSFLQGDIDEYAYGTLYSGYIQKVVQGGYQPVINGDNDKPLPYWAYDMRVGNKVHDYYLHIDNDAEYQWTMNPVDLAVDQYNVMGNGISGSIYPYRLDIGTLSTNNYNQWSGIIKSCFEKFSTDKVNFRYKGDIANHYSNHTGEGYDVNMDETDLEGQFGITFVEVNSGFNMYVNDNILLYPGSQTESDRDGLYAHTGDIKTKKLAAGKHIEWFSNKEIRDGIAFNTSNFMDFLSSTDRANFRNNNTGADHGIGGYAITREDGVTYHYALPIICSLTFNYTESKIEGVTDNTKAYYRNNNQYAIDWLLTAITGPDFIDRNNNNMVDVGDWGYWVKFNYSKGDNFRSRTPAEGYVFSADKNQWTYNVTDRNTYYLKTIETPSHFAFFKKSVRNDGRYFVEGLSDLSSYKLDDIYLLSRKDYNDIISQYPTKISSFELSPREYSPDEELQNYINSKQIKKLHFNYNYSLCVSDPSNFSGRGRLTLNSVGFYGLNDTKLMPDFGFKYGINASYNKDNWDAWGMYKFGGSNSNRKNTSEGDQWSLRRILTPEGGIIEVAYERDTYANVAGFELPDEKYGGNLRVIEIAIDDGVNPKLSTKYIYSRTGLPDDLTSGVCSYEPEYDRSTIDLYDIGKKTSLFNYPRTPVLYKNITVLSNKLDGQYLSKTEFEFIMPNYNMINCYAKDDIVKDGYLGDYQAKWANYLIKDNTNQIGALKSIKKYYNNDLTQSVTYNYTSDLPNNQGVFTEGTVFYEWCNWGPGSAVVRLFRTTKIKYPNAIKSVIYQSGDNSSEVINKDFDFKTGLVRTKEYDNSKGDDFIVETLPAYEVYPQMGLKAKAHSNKNMLTQQFAEITYLKDGEDLKVKKASVQTWNNVWDYRVYREKHNVFRDESNSEIYRLRSQYNWKGAINSDGTYHSSNFLNYNTVDKLKDNLSTIIDDPAENWQETVKIEKYNPFSYPIQIKDINGINASLKPDFNNNYIIASATNCPYSGFGYTGFENATLSADKIYFDSEIFMDTPQVITRTNEEKHTGNYSLKSAKGGMVDFLGDLSDGEIKSAYKISFWVKPLDNAKDFSIIVGTKFYNHSGNSHLNSSFFNKSNTVKFGNWYLIEAFTNRSEDIPDIKLMDKLWIFTRNNGEQVVYIDDFRFHPVKSVVNATVYDKQTGKITAVLDNNNIATKYEYNAAGKVKAVYKETSDGFKKVSEQDYGYARPIYNPFKINSIVTDVSVLPESGNKQVIVTLEIENKDIVRKKCIFGCYMKSTAESVSRYIPRLGSATVSVKLIVDYSISGKQSIRIKGAIEDNISVDLPASSPANLHFQDYVVQETSPGKMRSTLTYYNDGGVLGIPKAISHVYNMQGFRWVKVYEFSNDLIAHPGQSTTIHKDIILPSGRYKIILKDGNKELKNINIDINSILELRDYQVFEINPGTVRTTLTYRNPNGTGVKLNVNAITHVYKINGRRNNPDDWVKLMEFSNELVVYPGQINSNFIDINLPGGRYYFILKEGFKELDKIYLVVH